MKAATSFDYTTNLRAAPKGLDQGLLLFADADVSANTTITVTYTKGSATPVNPSTWITQDDLVHTLDNVSDTGAICLHFNTISFANANSLLTITAKQKRLATDTVAVAPMIGAMSIYPPSWVELGKVETNVWYTLPVRFAPFSEQPTRELYISLTSGASTVTLDTATAYLAPNYQDLYD